MMDDTISRQAAIDAICEHGTDLERRGITVIAVVYHKQATVDLLENLPSAERHGKWEPIVIGGGVWGTQCSKCHAIDLYGKTPYCPNCGARMEAE